ncbi:MAG: hypothetical protein K2F83_00810 [Oscillospiraceae bacterium]|nr:hypothetical protein [Oscillospiraceae bacterium]
MEKTIYILLSRSITVPSRIIHFFTRGEFTHTSVGLEGPGGAFYSFGRLNINYPLPGGMVREQVGRGFYARFSKTPCCLFALKISAEAFAELEARLARMYARRRELRYNIIGLGACLFRLPLRRRDAYFCSQFVAELLMESGAANLPYPPEATKPMDFTTLPGLQVLYRGAIDGMAG